MSNDFSFDKKTLSFLLGGFAFVGIMLFIAGLLIGTNWRTEQPAIASAATGGQPAAAAPLAAEPAPAPKQPVIRAPAAEPESDAPAEVDAPDAAPAPAKQAHGSTSLEIRKEPAPAQLYKGEVKILERANSSAIKADDLNRMDQSSFSVQVGVFVDEQEANHLVTQLRNKGYTPFVLATNDDESRTWYAVRIGTYADRAEAERTALNIATQEKIKTYVRPLGSL
jgi:septal ring-binding cell division protein DamX